MYYTIPNLLTIFRFVLIPFFLNTFFSPQPWVQLLALPLFVLAAVTDFLDGWLARRWQEESDFGRLTDPLADKLLVISVLFAVQNRVPMFFENAWIRTSIWVMLVLEMIVTAFAMRAFYVKTPLRTTLVGKVKTALQLVTLVLALLYAQLIPLETLDWEPAVVWLHSPLPAGLFPWLFGLSAALTVWASLLNLHINLLKRWRRGEAWPVEENADTR